MTPPSPVALNQLLSTSYQHLNLFKHAWKSGTLKTLTYILLRRKVLQYNKSYWHLLWKWEYSNDSRLTKPTKPWNLSVYQALKMNFHDQSETEAKLKYIKHLRQWNDHWGPQKGWLLLDPYFLAQEYWLKSSETLLFSLNRKCYSLFCLCLQRSFST